MVIASTEFTARIGLFYYRARRNKSNRLLNIYHVIFVNLYASIGSECIPVMLLLTCLCFYEHYDISTSSNGKKETNYDNRYALSNCIHKKGHCYLICIIIICIILLIILSGDVEPNPGPSSQLTTESSSSDEYFDEFSRCLNQYTSFIHLNVQSLLPKIDLIHAELRNIDILCFSET